MANTKKMATLGLFMVLIGLILAAVGGYIYNSNKDKSSGEKHTEVINKQNELGSKIDSSKDLISSKLDTIEKKAGTVITKNETKNIVNAPNALIVTQDQSGGQNTVNIFQNEYKPLNNDIRSKVEKNLAALIKKYPVHPVVQIEIESGNGQRFKIAEALEIILQPYNLGRFHKNNTSIGRFPDSPISVFVNPSNVEFAKAFMKAIHLYVTSDYKVIEIPQWENGGGGMRLYFNGTPSFSIDGSVKVD